MTKVLESEDCDVTTSSRFLYTIAPSSDYYLDDISIVSTDLSTTTTFQYNDANELTKRTVAGLDTTFTYDNWGRMVTKAIGTEYEATYAYRYGNKVYSVTSDFPGEGNVTYQYGGDGKRRERIAGGVTTKYNWDLGWNLLNEENSGGTLTMTYIFDRPLADVAMMLADVSGSSPSTGDYRHYVQDNLGSTRGLYDASKTSLGSYEYTPYGETYTTTGAAVTHKFTGKSWDSTAQLYYFPYRYYNPSLARWLTRDPLGMVDGPNVYAYVRGNPVHRTDPLGQGIGNAACFGICMTTCWTTYIAETIAMGVACAAFRAICNAIPDKCLREKCRDSADWACDAWQDAADQRFDDCEKGCRKICNWPE